MYWYASNKSELLSKKDQLAQEREEQRKMEEDLIEQQLQKMTPVTVSESLLAKIERSSKAPPPDEQNKPRESDRTQGLERIREASDGDRERGGYYREREGHSEREYRRGSSQNYDSRSSYSSTERKSTRSRDEDRRRYSSDRRERSPRRY